MNKELRGTILSMSVAVLVIVVSVLSYHFLRKNTNLSQVNEEVQVETNTTKNVTLINGTNLQENYNIDVETEKFYHFKIVLETNNEISYEVLLNGNVISSSSSKEGAITLYEGEFQNYKESYQIIINNSSTEPNNKLKFIY